MSVEYAARLHGSEVDLGDLRLLFADGEVRVSEITLADGQQITALLARDFIDPASDMLVVGRARELVDQLNGILFVQDQDREAVQTGAIYKRTDGGPWGSGVAYATGTAGGISRVRGRGIAVVLAPDGTRQLVSPPAPRQAAWLAYACADQNASGMS